jgi:hypothetical protein
MAGLAASPVAAQRSSCNQTGFNRFPSVRQLRSPDDLAGRIVDDGQSGCFAAGVNFEP